MITPAIDPGIAPADRQLFAERVALKLHIPLAEAKIALAIALAGRRGVTRTEIEDANPSPKRGQQSNAIAVHLHNLRHNLRARDLSVETVHVAPRYQMSDATAQAVLRAAGLAHPVTQQGDV